MPRVSRKQAEQHRKDVVVAAARLFRERGFDGVSVPALMAEVGLTHGAFYGHFASKDDLATAACQKAFDDVREHYAGIFARSKGDMTAARADFINRYATKAHRDAPGLGCVAAALAGDVSRTDQKSSLRVAFAAGMESILDMLEPLFSRRTKKPCRQQTLEAVAMLVGALLISRATKGSDISDEILTTVRTALLDRK